MTMRTLMWYYAAVNTKDLFFMTYTISFEHWILHVQVLRAIAYDYSVHCGSVRTGSLCI